MQDSLYRNKQGYLDITAAKAIISADRKNKYVNTKTTVNGIIFDSKKEAKRYTELKLLEKAGAISDLRLQVPFELIPKQEGEQAVKYIADFVYNKNGNIIAEDTKGYRTKEYIIKRKLFKWLYKDYEFRET